MLVFSDCFEWLLDGSVLEVVDVPWISLNGSVRNEGNVSFDCKKFRLHCQNKLTVELIR